MTDASDPYPRLEPTDTTLKDLFAKSGNQCAFPACRVPVVDELGTVLCQIVHIKGVKPTSPRFDATQSPDDRRHRTNLLIMCNPHHKVTDDEEVYPVEKMRSIKAGHEGRFAGVITGLQGTVEDQTKYTVVFAPESMSKYAQVCGLTAEEALESRSDYVTLLNQLAKLPPDARSVLATIVDRGVEGGLASWSMEGGIEVLLPELRDVLGIDDYQLRDELAILKKYELADLDPDGSEESLGAAVAVAIPRIKGVDDYALRIIRDISREIGIPVARAIVGLDFRLLDG